MKSLVKSIAENEQTVVATGYFSSSFDVNKKVDAEQQQSLSGFYSGAFSDEFKQRDPGFNGADAGNAQAALDDPARYFQMRYISTNPNPLGKSRRWIRRRKLPSLMPAMIYITHSTIRAYAVFRKSLVFLMC
ncbi:hypothetical protein [Aliamphritea spongicola]|nr:hypothetical protein [Aliamphritea spongicola]